MMKLPTFTEESIEHWKVFADQKPYVFTQVVMEWSALGKLPQEIMEIYAKAKARTGDRWHD